MTILDPVHGKRITDEIKKMLWEKAGPEITNQGYLPNIESNLIPGIHPHQFLGDMENGAGQELRWKFRAVHSSSALVVNHFALFKYHPERLRLINQEGFRQPGFERKLPTGLGGTPPTIDVWLQRGTEGWAIESKLLEYFTPKKAVFSASYTRKALPWAEECWWQVLEDAQESGRKHLDIAQLVKHYLGLSRLLGLGREIVSGALLYLFWEPENGLEIEVCRRHREELNDLSGRVANSLVSFKWMPYPDVWREWEKVPVLAPHVVNLRGRYGIYL